MPYTYLLKLLEQLNNDAAARSIRKKNVDIKYASSYSLLLLSLRLLQLPELFRNRRPDGHQVSNPGFKICLLPVHLLKNSLAMSDSASVTGLEFVMASSRRGGALIHPYHDGN